MVIRLCQSGVFLNTRSSCSNPIMEGGRREGKKVVTCIILKVGSIWKLRGFLWYQQRAVGVLLPTPHPSSMAHLNLLTLGPGTRQVSLVVERTTSRLRFPGSQLTLPALCFWANYLTLLFTELDNRVLTGVSTL